MRRAWPRWLAPAVLMALPACSALFGGPHEQASPAARGAAYFHDGDFGSPHQTGVPYALAVATIEHYPDALGGDRDRFCEKFGIASRSDRPDSLPKGFALRRDGITGLDFVMTNCSFCHNSEIQGRDIPGLGSRTLRLNALNRAVIDVVTRGDFNEKTMLPLAHEAAKRHHTPWGWRGAWATKVAIRRLKERAGQSLGSLGGMKDLESGPGRNSAIEFAKTVSKIPITAPYSYSKYPAVWVYGKRATFGYDASIVGDRAMALSAVEINKGMPPKDVVKRREQWEDVYAYLLALEPPPYPVAVDSALADRGHAVFVAHCSGCHGTYARGRVPGHYEENVVPLATIHTDPDRLHSVTPDLVEARRKGPVARYVHIEPTNGYVAPPLDGIWCRGPYLHNGSVPTLVDLLVPPSERPVVFYVGAGTDYDLERVGLAYTADVDSAGHRVGGRASPRQYVFDTALPGNSNGGHDIGAWLTPVERRAVLEYLKQL